MFTLHYLSSLLWFSPWVHGSGDGVSGGHITGQASFTRRTRVSGAEEETSVQPTSDAA